MPRLVKLGFIVLVIAIVSAGGWVVWGKNSDTDKKALEDNSSQQTPDQDTAGPNEDDSDKYLVISEWGVRITLPEDLRTDVSYFMNDRAEKAFGGPILADLVSEKFSNGTLKCAVIEGDVPRSLVSIERIDLNINPTTPDTYPKPLKTFGAYAYRLSTPACENAINREGSDADRLLLESLKTAVENTLEPVN